jgi:hypothetical protein
MNYDRRDKKKLLYHLKIPNFEILKFPNVLPTITALNDHEDMFDEE